MFVMVMNMQCWVVYRGLFRGYRGLFRMVCTVMGLRSGSTSRNEVEECIDSLDRMD